MAGILIVDQIQNSSNTLLINSGALAGNTVGTAQLQSGITVAANTITANTITTTSVTSTSVNTTSVTSNTVSAAIIPTNSFNYRNKFVNGNFDFWQRGTSATMGSGLQTGIWSYGSADRWGGHYDGGTAGTYSRDTAVPNSLSTYSMKMAGASGGTSAYLDQRIEASELRELINAGSVTISGWIRRNGSASSTISVNLITPTATDNYASYNTLSNVFQNNNYISGDGTATGSVLTLTTAGTWYYFKVTDLNFNTTSRTGLANGAQIYFAGGSFSSSSNGYNFAQLQIEAGPNATPFEQRPYATELALCQRYYEVHNQQVYSTSGSPGTNYYYYWHMKVTKRGSPTVTSPGGYSVSSTGGDITTAYVYGGSGTYMRVDGITAAAEL